MKNDFYMTCNVYVLIIDDISSQPTWLLSSLVSFIASSKHNETCLFSSAFDISSFCGKEKSSFT